MIFIIKYKQSKYLFNIQILLLELHVTFNDYLDPHQKKNNENML